MEELPLPSGWCWMWERLASLRPNFTLRCSQSVLKETSWFSGKGKSMKYFTSGMCLPASSGSHAYYLYITHLSQAGRQTNQPFLERAQHTLVLKHVGFVGSLNAGSLNCVWGQPWVGSALKLFSEPSYAASTVNPSCFQNTISGEKNKLYTCF